MLRDYLKSTAATKNTPDATQEQTTSLGWQRETDDLGFLRRIRVAEIEEEKLASWASAQENDRSKNRRQSSFSTTESSTGCKLDWVQENLWEYLETIGVEGKTWTFKGHVSMSPQSSTYIPFPFPSPPSPVSTSHTPAIPAALSDRDPNLTHLTDPEVPPCHVS